MSMIAKEGAWESLFKAIRTGMDWSFSGKYGLDHTYGNLSVFFLAWTCVIATGFLAVIVSRTVLINSRFAGIVSFILFFVINGIVEYIYNLFAKYGLMGIHSGLYIGIGECAILYCCMHYTICDSSVLARKEIKCNKIWKVQSVKSDCIFFFNFTTVLSHVKDCGIMCKMFEKSLHDNKKADQKHLHNKD